MSRDQLVALVEQHGEARVEAVLRECGGAERPVAMAASRLRATDSAAPVVAIGTGIFDDPDPLAEYRKARGL